MGTGVLNETAVFIFMGNGNIGFLLLLYSSTEPYGVMCRKAAVFVLNSL